MGSWKQEFGSLRTKLIEKIGVSAATFDKRVIRLAQRENTTPRVALFLVAKSVKVSSVRDFGKLSSSEQAAVASTSSPRVHTTQVATTYISRAKPSTTSRVNRQAISKKWYEKWWGKGVVIPLIVTFIGGILVIIIASLVGLSA